MLPASVHQQQQVLTITAPPVSQPQLVLLSPAPISLASLLPQHAAAIMPASTVVVDHRVVQEQQALLEQATQLTLMNQQLQQQLQQQQQQQQPLRVSLPTTPSHEQVLIALGKRTDNSQFVDIFTIPSMKEYLRHEIMHPTVHLHSFPYKIHQMLARFPQAIAWNDHGRSFGIRDTQLFVEQVLPHYCRQTKWSSFRRQLNIYGFRRVTQKGKEYGSYYHELFIRGYPDLCHYMQRVGITASPPTATKASSSPPTSPCRTTTSSSSSSSSMPSSPAAVSTTSSSCSSSSSTPSTPIRE